MRMRLLVSVVLLTTGGIACGDTTTSKDAVDATEFTRQYATGHARSHETVPEDAAGCQASGEGDSYVCDVQFAPTRRGLTLDLRVDDGEFKVVRVRRGRHAFPNLRIDEK